MIDILTGHVSYSTLWSQFVMGLSAGSSIKWEEGRGGDEFALDKTLSGF